MRTLIILMLVSVSAFAQEISVSPMAVARVSATSSGIARDTVDAENRQAYSSGYSSFDEEIGKMLVGTSGGDLKEQGGIEFQLSIPQGATIDSAFVSFSVQSVYSWAAGESCIINIFDVDNASVFDATHTHEILSHETASGTTITWVPWGGAPATGSIRTSDIKTLIQIPISRGGWSAGNYLGLVFVRNNETANHHFATELWGAGIEVQPTIVVYYH